MLLPVLGAIALLVKLTSRGPVVFAHTRIGRGGRPVRVLKFRTMRKDSQAALREYLAKNPEAKKEWEETFKLQNDPRVTRIGKFLRNTSLDELPQLWNVIRGEMSVVGPRPIVNEEIVRYGSYFKFYAAVKPGITGLWQVCGRNDTTYEQRVRIDEYYVRNWSPWLDLYVLARTAITLIRRTGAY
jgi:undecaprenyl-phosphate galactose phosphotransferase